MANHKTKLELTWIGKENRPKLEPRILVEDAAKSHHAPFRTGKNDIFDNRLVFGDNLLALKALEQEFAGKIKCIYIDPPFNTQQAFEHYDDGLEHTLWLSLMRDRLALLGSLLSNEGTLCVHIDDNELGYLLVVLDEILGRQNKAFIATFKQGSATGHKAINPGCVSTSNYVVVYAKDKRCWTPHKVHISRERNKRYNQFILNRNESYHLWNIVPLSKAFSLHCGVSPREAKRQVPDFEAELNKFAFDHADSVIQLARPSYKGVSAAARELIDESKKNPKQVLYLGREKHSDMYFIRGERIIFFKDTLRNIDGNVLPGEPLTTIWDDIPSHNLHNEGGVDFPKGKKPEALVKRLLELFTNEGDWVLDSFAGSGTTGAVAHKLSRHWIMVELGEHCHTHIIPRLKKMIDGEDQGGVSKAVNWKGGGGFRYYRLGPSLLQKDEFGNWVISKEYNPAMLAEAMCKLEGFTYAPSGTATPRRRISST
jgi:adenine-specific DNA-methyltransferase